MFTGIIESTGKIQKILREGSNTIFEIETDIASELKVDQSLAHNGVCLTITEVKGHIHCVTAVEETLLKTSLGQWKEGAIVNLERSMPANGRFDGHIVQGHVDQTGVCTKKETLEGSWLFDFEYDASQGNFLVEKGSVCIDGVSLTVFDVSPGKFRVTIIPYTYEHTNFQQYEEGTIVNLEFDVIGKYISTLLKHGYKDFLQQLQ